MELSKQHSSVSNNDRLYALDSLRALMLLLGIVLHTVLSYSSLGGAGAWPFVDYEGTTKYADHAYYFIHSYRMPVFFILAGFFSALLFTRRGPIGLTINRVLRIGIPFVLGLLILYPLVYLSFSFSGKAASESISSNNITSIIEAGKYVIRATALNDLFPPKNTGHLWFLYYLLFFYILIIPIGLLNKGIKKSWLTISCNLFQIVIKNPLLRIIVLTLCTSYLLHRAGGGALRTSTNFSLDKSVFLIYFFFFGFGWLLFYSKEILFEFKNYAWAQTIIGFILYLFISLWLVPNVVGGNYEFLKYNYFSISIVASILVWLMFFGLTGIFLRYLDYNSKYVRYIVDASYWLYLIHLPIVVFIPGFMVATGISVWLKMFITFSGTCLIGLVTYDLFVRNTIIGKTLSGRRYKRGLPHQAA